MVIEAKYIPQSYALKSYIQPLAAMEAISSRHFEEAAIAADLEAALQCGAESEARPERHSYAVKACSF